MAIFLKNWFQGHRKGLLPPMPTTRPEPTDSARLGKVGGISAPLRASEIGMLAAVWEPRASGRDVLLNNLADDISAGHLGVLQEIGSTELLRRWDSDGRPLMEQVKASENAAKPKTSAQWYSGMESRREKIKQNFPYYDSCVLQVLV